MGPVNRKRQPEPNGLVHALLYRRVSGAEHQREGLSLETQQKALRAYVARLEGWIIDGEFEDIRSGRRADRSGYQAMLARARQLHDAGARAAVVIVRPDRFGRRLREYLNVAEELIRSGVVIHTTESGAELDEEWAAMKMVWAQKEGKLIGKRVQETRRTVVDKGWPYGRVAFGYRSRPPTDAEIAAGCRPDMAMIEPDPLTRDVAVELFTRVAEGASVSSTTKWLIDQLAVRRGGRSWGHNSVMALLHSPTYVARPAEGVDDVLSRPVARWEPLVSDDVWSLVQERMAGHARRGRYASGQYLLTGFLRCAKCGSRMGTTGRGGDGARVYRCMSKASGANAPIKGCQYGIPARIADGVVLGEVDRLVEVFTNPKCSEPQLREAWRQLQTPKRDDVRARRLAELDGAEKKARHELADAARLLVHRHDRLAYEALRDEQVAALEAIAKQREALGEAPPTVPVELPALDEVLRLCGGWATVIRAAKVPDQRALLETLLTTVRLVRVGWGKYEADVEWTPLGKALAEILQAELRAA